MLSSVLVNCLLFGDISLNPKSTSKFTTNPVTVLPVFTELKSAGEFLVTPRLITKVPVAFQWLICEVGTKRVSLYMYVELLMPN